MIKFSDMLTTVIYVFGSPCRYKYKLPLKATFQTFDLKHFFNFWILITIKNKKKFFQLEIKKFCKYLLR